MNAIKEYEIYKATKNDHMHFLNEHVWMEWKLVLSWLTWWNQIYKNYKMKEIRILIDSEWLYF